MNCYLIHDEDAEARVVQASDYGVAVKAWRRQLIKEWTDTGDYEPGIDEDRQPTSVTAISGEFAIIAPEASPEIP